MQQSRHFFRSRSENRITESGNYLNAFVVSAFMISMESGTFFRRRSVWFTGLCDPIVLAHERSVLFGVIHQFYWMFVMSACLNIVYLFSLCWMHRNKKKYCFVRKNAYFYE